jgi:hypothetical protein
MYVPNHKLYTSCMCQIINYTPHVCANSSTTCLNHIPNMYLNHIPKTYTNINIKIYLTIHHSIHKPNTINPYIKPCDTTSLLSSLKLNQQLQRHITNKRPIPICQIPIVSLNKSDICSNTKHPIPSQEINPSSQNIHQTRCAISLINRPQPCSCRTFFVAIFLLHFFCRDFFCHTFSTAIFLLYFCFHSFPASLFLPHFFCCKFSLSIIPAQITFQKNRYSMIFNCV